jgi:hypothetical protein
MHNLKNFNYLNYRFLRFWHGRWLVKNVQAFRKNNESATY